MPQVEAGLRVKKCFYRGGFGEGGSDMVDAVCMFATGDVICVSAMIDGNPRCSRYADAWSMRASGPV